MNLRLVGSHPVYRVIFYLRSSSTSSSVLSNKVLLFYLIIIYGKTQLVIKILIISLDHYSHFILSLDNIKILR